MTRRHFEAIAATIREANIEDDARQTLARDMANTLARFNPNFDRARFITACGAEKVSA